MRIDTGTANNLRVLMLEDLELDAELCHEELKRGGLSCDVHRVDTRQGFENALEGWRPDIILSDFSMPRFDGMSALGIARERTPATPFIFVSGTIGEERAVEAMKRGATDYVLKHHMNRLVPVVKRALREQSERDAHRKTGRALDETRARLDGILASLTDAVWSVSLAPMEVSYANAAAESVYGRPLSELVSQPGLVLDAVHPDDRARFTAAWADAANGGMLDVEHRVITPEGDVRWIHVRARGVRGDDGRIVRIDGISRNITRRRNAEERVARLTRVRAVLSGINAAIVRVRDPAQLYHDACHIVVHDGGFGFAWAGRVEGARGHIDPIAHCCLDLMLTRGNGIALQMGGDSPPALIAQAARSGKVVLSNALQGDEALIEGGRDEPRGFRSIAVVPIRCGDRMAGVLALFGAEPDFFGEQEVKLLDELSANLSFAMDYMEKAASVDYLAYYDALTELPNRRLFFDRLAQLATLAHTERYAFAVAVIDIARFRGINETLGPSGADAILTESAKRLRDAGGAAATCARITSDRFALTLHDLNPESGAALAIEHVMKSFDEPFEVDGTCVAVQARAGVAMFPEDGATPDALFANAEAALQHAKRSGARLRFYAREMNARAAEMLQLENELHAAVRERQFVLHYQPRVELRTGRICGFEALIRWQSPARGLVPPGVFIPLLEDTGLVLHVGRWALQQAAADAAQWHRDGIVMPPIGVNVSAVQLRESDFVDHVLDAIASVGGSRSSIELELTESVVMSDVEGNARKLAAIRDAGVRIAIDDFGTGYSSLAYLARLPVDALKIDRSFVSSMNDSPVQMAIVTTVISLARSLGLSAVAEGVESEDEARVLATLRCDEGQGFLYSRPVPAAAVPALLTRMGNAEDDRTPLRALQRAAHERTVSRLRRLLGRG
ncbi:MAG TPA: EAL domain-containing protein [Burkholderiales bacterium]|nr:EAL domain-containing protein [Burkholderiales bacterium]